MNRQYAIQTLKAHLEHWERLCTENIAPISEGEKTIGALKMAIEALQTEVVRCKDCRYYSPIDENRPYPCAYGIYMCNKNDFCSYGERKGSDGE